MRLVLEFVFAESSMTSSPNPVQPRSVAMYVCPSKLMYCALLTLKSQGYALSALSGLFLNLTNRESQKVFSSGVA